MTERRLFEIWWKDVYGDTCQRSLKKDRDGEYVSLLARWAWVGWKERASRAARIDRAMSEDELLSNLNKE